MLSYLPFWLLYFISDVIRFFGFRIFHYRKSVVTKNIKRSFYQFDKKEQSIIERSFQQNLTDIIVETIKFLTISQKDLDNRLLIKNITLPNNYLQEGRGIIFFNSHLCNWEWMSAIARILEKPSITFYQPLKSDYFERLMVKIRTRFGLKVIPSKQGYRYILKNFNNNVVECYNLIGDQSPTLNWTSKVWIKFLNQDTAFNTGPAEIAKRTDHVILFPAMRRLKRGHYEVEFKVVSDNPTVESVESLTERYASMLEEEINNAPSDWLWSHRRWKLKK